MPHYTDAMCDDFEGEHKDLGVIIDDPSNDDGFKVLNSPPKFSDTSELNAQDHATQQMIFDRLPLSKSNRAEFYKWLTEEYIEEQRQEEQATKQRQQQRKRQRQETEPCH
jgi:hypothetical protein